MQQQQQLNNQNPPFFASNVHLPQYHIDQPDVQLAQSPAWLNQNWQLSMFKQTLKCLESEGVSVLPVSHLNSSQELQEREYLLQLRQQMGQVLTSLAGDQQQSQKRIQSLQSDHQEQLRAKDATVSELRRRLTALKTENSSLKTNLEQTLRYIRRYELKQQLTNNQIAHLQKQITEKEAIIRYLEQRTLPRPAHPMPPLPSDSGFDDLASTYGKSELSFAKIRSTNNLKFEDYNSAKSKEDSQLLCLGSRGKRVRTESTEVKENVNSQNMQGRGLAQLANFMSGGSRKEEGGKTQSMRMNESFMRLGGGGGERGKRRAVVNSMHFLDGQARV